MLHPTCKGTGPYGYDNPDLSHTSFPLHRRTAAGAAAGPGRGGEERRSGRGGGADSSSRRGDGSSHNSKDRRGGRGFETGGDAGSSRREHGRSLQGAGTAARDHLTLPASDGDGHWGGGADGGRGEEDWSESTGRSATNAGQNTSLSAASVRRR